MAGVISRDGMVLGAIVSVNGMGRIMARFSQLDLLETATDGAPVDLDHDQGAGSTLVLPPVQCPVIGPQGILVDFHCPAATASSVPATDS